MAQRGDLLINIVESFRSLGKLIIQSRRPARFAAANQDSRLVVMGNGPSLRTLLDSHELEHSGADLLAVNFAANAEEFYTLRPRYYVIADPHFFRSESDPNVARLIDNLRYRIVWPMTLFVPADALQAVVIDNPSVQIVPYNCVGIEGWEWLRMFAYGRRLGMPRPRNVLIPSLMIGLWLGYKTIFVAGADHSWTRTLEVNERNEVISVQPHFYRDNSHEQARVTSEYKGVRLHEVIHSFYIAFRAYFDIESYARSIGARIYNITPGSFIDAFERRDPHECLSRS